VVAVALVLGQLGLSVGYAGGELNARKGKEKTSLISVSNFFIRQTEQHKGFRKIF
jgi:hypothetical protein